MNIEILKRQLRSRYAEVMQGYKIAGGLVSLLDDEQEEGSLSMEVRWASALQTIFDFLSSDLACLLSDLEKMDLETEANEPVSAGTITKHLDNRSN